MERTLPMPDGHDRNAGMQAGAAFHPVRDGRGEQAIAAPHGGARVDGAKAEDRFLVSIVVPTCGRADLLNRCLAGLTAQNFAAGDYEVIIVDDAPSDATRKVVGAWTERMADRGLEVRYLPNRGPHGPAAARNRGWQAARSPIIAFTDDDTVPTADWLRHGLAAFEKGAGVVRGRIEMPLSSTPSDYERDAKHLETAEFVTANCLARRAVLEQLGGFDERFRLAWREDSDLHFRLLDHGIAIADAPQAVVIHPVRPASWGVSMSQQKKVVFDALLYKKHPRRYRERIRATPRWDYYLIVLCLLGAPLALLLGKPALAAGAAIAWLLMTGRFCLARLRGTRKTASHVAEMVLTSAAIPPLAVYWRMVGALRFRVAFL
ncbi:Glycosyltransferase, GT2 family [Noviherbaspirillum humi]|uniref:Glycosyltransferase, GT2 family n=1 Tax=Noviherbaspirillum humi TaxID=1688639 RepID=A0A239J0C0_9BURK|nr:glycosyltransferase [Noviherbaspirillum humi]SNS99249.1 Glycosyltransferase, GT2 family [Noviherbaspirillum humi]